MSRYISKSVLLLTFSVVIYYTLYQLSPWGIAPFQANGSMLTGPDGNVVSSRQSKAGDLVAPDIEAWFQQDKDSGKPDTAAQWADAHNSSTAQAWVNADQTHRWNRDVGAAETPLLQQPRTVCRFYDC